MKQLWYVKNCLLKDFDKWVEEGKETRMRTTEDVFEFLIQKGFLKGKQFNNYIDSLPELSLREQIEMSRPFSMREGFIPPRTWIGKKTK